MPSVDFDAPDLGKQLDALGDRERHALPFGVILLDRDGLIQFYSETEQRQAKYQGQKIGQNFFDMAKRPNKDELRQSIMRAMEEGGRVDLEFGWAGDHSDPKRQFRLRVQSANSGGVWLCFERDDEPAGTPRP
jgi:hypothetical protein